MLEFLEQLYLHRILHLNKYAIKQIALQNNQDLSIPTKQELSAYMLANCLCTQKVAA
jgi:hypothetical protein